MEHFIDSLSKQLAKTASRRAMLGVASRTLFASFVTSTGVGRFWARAAQTTTSSPQTCPSCGTCQQCNTQAGKCGQDCENPCTAAVLCNLAQQFPPYFTLHTFLAGLFPICIDLEAFVIQVPKVNQTSVLSQSYTGTDPSQTATLFFTDTNAGFGAYAIQYSKEVPQYVYTVNQFG